MVFEDIIGQEAVKGKLLEYFVSGKLSHAYLFVGPDGIGRKTLAASFASLLMCFDSKDKGELCSECQSCNLNRTKNNPDYHLIGLDKGKNTIGIETIRQMQETMTKAPVFGKKSVYVIDQADKMTPQAQNAFLKTLEEPAPYLMLILIASNTSLLLETVLSRLSRIDFQRNSNKEVRAILENRGLVADDFLLSFSDGIPGRAINYIDENMFMSTIRYELLKNINRLYTDGCYARKDLMKVIEENASNREFIFYVLLSVYRDAMLINRYRRDIDLQNAGNDEEIYSLSKKISFHNARESIKIVDSTWKKINRNSNYKLICELMLIRLQEEVHG